MKPYLDPYGDLFALLSFPSDQRLRKKLVWAYSWAVPSPEVLAELLNHGPLLEIGAGTGYWAWLLSQAGADIVAYDCNITAPPHWFDVQEGGPEKIAEHPDRTLLLCWPPLGEGMATECLKLYRGETLLSIGECGEGARTGDGEMTSDFACVREIALPRWTGFRDSLWVGRRV
jgi:hypothetical protein